MNDEVTSMNELHLESTIYAQKSFAMHVTIYSGIIIKTNTKVAVKLYKGSDLTCFQTEIGILRYISHKGETFLKFYGSFAFEGSLVIVMELCEQTLSSLIHLHRAEKKTLRDQTYKIAQYLIESFASLESEKIYHRDIKPENILISDNMVPKIIDFSISIVLPEQEKKNQLNMYSVSGTQSYMSPELLELQKSGSNYGMYNLGLSDVFSLGLTLIVMITLDEVHQFSLRISPDQIMKKIREIQEPFYQELLSDMLQTQPQSRKTFQELLEKYFYIKLVNFPIGNIEYSQVKLVKEICKTSEEIRFFEGILPSGAKITVKLYENTPENQKKAKYLAMNLFELNRGPSCFLRFFVAFEDIKFIWVVHEHCELTLRNVIDLRKASDSQFTDREIFYYIKTLCEAFFYCYQNNIFHNYIRSDALYVTPEGYLKVSNFNIPFLNRKTELDSSIRTMQISGDCNEEFYLAPEIFSELYNFSNVSRSLKTKDYFKSDIFSIGLISYELFTLGNTKSVRMNNNEKILEVQINSIKSNWGQFLLRKMLAWDPNNRADYKELNEYIEYFSAYLS